MGMNTGCLTSWNFSGENPSIFPRVVGVARPPDVNPNQPPGVCGRNISLDRTSKRLEKCRTVC